MQPTALLYDDACLAHRMQPRHPERPERLQAIRARLRDSGLAEELDERSAAPATDGVLLRVHTAGHLEALQRMAPEAGLVGVDPDTAMCPETLDAARLAAGANVAAVDGVMNGAFLRAFCAVRPPGHHAESARAMGFCFFNNVAVAAAHALGHHGLERIAVLDFDVHHGNGTVEMFRDDPRVLVCSSYQHPFYPGRMWEVKREHIVHSPLAVGSRGVEFRRAVERQWIPAVERHRPQLVLVSAGFDAHADDPLAGLRFAVEDYRWITQVIVALANDHCRGRVVATLEGGYDLDALAASVEAHLAALLAA